MSSGPLCMYCDKPTGKVRKGDHLVPAAIGGTVATKDVCSKCNNELSDIDREICSRSPLSLVAAKEIEGHVAQAWDVDESDHNLLLEGRPDFQRCSFRVFPQMIVMPQGEQLRGDWTELSDPGPLEGLRVLTCEQNGIYVDSTTDLLADEMVKVALSLEPVVA